MRERLPRESDPIRNGIAGKGPDNAMKSFPLFLISPCFSRNIAYNEYTKKKHFFDYGGICPRFL